jgi:peptide chain release factor 1
MELSLDGEGGSDFLQQLFDMYQSHAKRHNYGFQAGITTELSGGMKSANITVSGNGAYSRLRYESGLHKAVGKFPQKFGAASVIVEVYPEAEAVEFDISDKDVRIDVFHASGAGGQNVNKVETAIRVTHFPSGIVVTCQDERSQLKNKERAMKTLYSKLADYYKRQSDSRYAELKRGLTCKLEKIRTYNYASNGVTDHRVNVTAAADGVFNGGIDVFSDAVILKNQNLR